MRERLVVTLVSLTVGILAVFGAVRAYSTADLVHDQNTTSVQQAADIVAVAIAAREQDRPPVTPDFLASLSHRAQSISYVDADGTTTSTAPIEASDDDIAVSRSVDGGGQVTLTQAGSVGADRVEEALLPLVVVGLGLALLAAIIGALLARQFSRPFRRLADDAILIGDGHFDVDILHSPISEAEDLGNALRSAALQLDALVRRERELAVVASHELRTPITALRLSLEDLTMWPQTPPEVAEELHHSLAEVDRLSGVVTALLARDDDGHLGAAVDVDLRELAAEAVARWARRAKDQGRELVLGPTDPSFTRVVRAPVERVVDILIENALAHGEGTISVEIVAVDHHFRFRVNDEGPRMIEPGVVHISPAGRHASLTDAATKAESLGGFVAVGDVPTTRVALVLPRPDST